MAKLLASAAHLGLTHLNFVGWIILLILPSQTLTNVLFVAAKHRKRNPTKWAMLIPFPLAALRVALPQIVQNLLINS